MYPFRKLNKEIDKILSFGITDSTIAVFFVERYLIHTWFVA